MDFLYFTIYYSVLAFVPVILYFLLLKKRNNDGSFSGADWYYPVKYFTARKAVRLYVEKHKNILKKVKDSLETEIDISSVENSNSQTFHGTDQKGNSLSLSVAIGIDKISELRLCLRLASGDTYILPESGKTCLINLAKEQWKIKGLSIEILEPYKRMRILFNGLLRKLGKNSNGKIEHVKFYFIFNSAASPVFVPQDLNENLLCSSLTGEVWKDSSWKYNLLDQIGFYQFGALQGFIKTDSDTSEKVLNLATCRSRFNGRDDRQVLKRSLTLLIIDKYGNCFNIVLKSLKNERSQMNYGSVFLSTNKSVQLKGTDIKLDHIGKHKTFPDHLVVHITIPGKVFKCVIDIEKNKQIQFISNTKYIGYECFNIPGQCDVNDTVGSALMEFSYKLEGDAVFLPKPRLSELFVKKIPMVLVTDIKNKEAQIVQLTGGKGNSLALLASLESKEFIVPDGFIITINAYRLQVESNENLKQSIQNLNDIYCGKQNGDSEASSNNVVNLFKNTTILPEIANAIKEYVGKYNDEQTRGWAVRSSAIGEDSEDLSAAGQNETFLGLQTIDQILKSVAGCWASLFKSQSVTYRWQHGLPIMADMAVVVQKIVPSDSAGVFFTCHPTTSNPAQMVITSNFGIGETVVSGDVDPDTFILERSWDNNIKILEQLKGLKGKKIQMKAESLEEVSNNVDEFSLNEKQLLTLGKIGVYIEDLFGNPRDIEWAFYEDQLYLLQSRPITTLNTWTDFELTHEMDYPLLTDQSIFTVANIREVMPNAITTLSNSTSVLAVERSLQQYVQENYDPFSRKGICIFQHNPFLDTIYSIHQNATEAIETVSLILDLSIFGHPVLDEKINNITLKRKGGPSTRISQGFQSMRVIKAAWRNAKILKRTKKLVDNLKFEMNEEADIHLMVRRIDESIDQIREISLCHSMTTTASVFYQVVSINILLEGGSNLTPDHYSDFAVILSSCEDVISAEIPIYLEKIAAMIRENFDGDEFCNLSDADGVDWLNKNAVIKKTFDEFLSKHGHRSFNEFEVMEKTWREDQTRIIQMIKANVKYGKISTKNHQTVDEIAKNLITPKKSSTRKIIKFLINKMRTAVGIREQTKSEVIRAIDMLRQAVRVLAKKMCSEGFIPQEHLMYHLTHYEIQQLITSRNPNLLSKAQRRAKLYPSWCSFKYPEISFAAPKPDNSEENEIKYKPVDCVSGTPVCSGSVTARACVIKTLNEIDQLQKGDILITYSTDIGWSPYFPMISGIVTELGGLVSHGAVVAREYGLPSIVGVKNVTKYFKTGDIVLLNGDKGELGRIE